MKKNKNNLSKFCILTVLLLFILSFSLIFTACDKNDVQNENVLPKLYLNEILYNAKTQTMTAKVSLHGKDVDELKNISVIPQDFESNVNLWYKIYGVVYNLPSNDIYSAVENKIPQEKRVKEGVTYTSLKVDFCYDTMFKSVKSNAKVTMDDDTYIHTLSLNKDYNNQVFKIEKTYQNSANWYTALITSALLVAMLIVLISIFTKRKKWHKK